MTEQLDTFLKQLQLPDDVLQQATQMLSPVESAKQHAQDLRNIQKSVPDIKLPVSEGEKIESIPAQLALDKVNTTQSAEVKDLTQMPGKNLREQAGELLNKTAAAKKSTASGLSASQEQSVSQITTQIQQTFATSMADGPYMAQNLPNKMGALQEQIASLQKSMADAGNIQSQAGELEAKVKSMKMV